MYKEWLLKVKDYDVHNELMDIKGKTAEINDRFCMELSFGTGGLRGIIGAGINRINVYTIGRATLGLAEYMLKNNKKKSVAIAYDSRKGSAAFARRAAELLSFRGITAYIFPEITPTPILSYAVRKLQCGAGIVITASHNPKEYNGYKVYNERGCQITDEAAEEIFSEIKKQDYFTDYTPIEKNIIRVGKNLTDEFLEEILKMSFHGDLCNLKIVYTPLHGTGNIPVRKLLEFMGAEVIVVKEQALPDEEFTTCPYPNPEERESLTIALEYAKREKADLVIATDPDADRIGVAVREKTGDYKLLNGNEAGILILNYTLMQKKEAGILGDNPTIIKTVVTTDMVFEIAQKYGARVEEVLTGFKYIGEKIEETENYIMGLEESCGYLIGTHVRDKDAVSAAMAVAEMCSYYKLRKKTLAEVLERLYEENGYYLTALDSLKYEGVSGITTIKELMKKIRNSSVSETDDEKFEITDFLNGINGLPKKDVLRLKNDTVRVVIRPSGTEPKLKIYYQARGNTAAQAEEKLKKLRGVVRQKLLS